MSKLAVIGSRSFDDELVANSEIESLVLAKSCTTIVSGGAKGADTLAARYAQAHGLELIEIKPDWARYGRGAGPLRNKLIIESADCVLAFWDGKSKGTLSALDHARKLRKSIKIIRYEKSDS